MYFKNIKQNLQVRMFNCDKWANHIDKEHNDIEGKTISFTCSIHVNDLCTNCKVDEQKKSMNFKKNLTIGYEQGMTLCTCVSCK
jgi:hypothetical protein